MCCGWVHFPDIAQLLKGNLCLSFSGDKGTPKKYDQWKSALLWMLIGTFSSFLAAQSVALLWYKGMCLWGGEPWTLFSATLTLL